VPRERIRVVDQRNDRLFEAIEKTLAHSVRCEGKDSRMYKRKITRLYSRLFAEEIRE
jgi:hypothetical protein